MVFTEQLTDDVLISFFLAAHLIATAKSVVFPLMIKVKSNAIYLWKIIALIAIGFILDVGNND